MPASSFFDTEDSADLPGFLVGLRRFIDQHNLPPAGPGKNPARRWQAEIRQIAGEVSDPVLLMLDFIGQLQADGLFDALLAGVGNATSDSQNYRAEISDLSLLDPHSDGVGVFQRNKGNPWFGFRRGELGDPDPRPWVFERRVRKKKTEISFGGAMVPPNIPLFLWNWFARVRATPMAEFGDCPDINDATLEALRSHMDSAMIWPGAGAVCLDENCVIVIYQTSLGWFSNVTIPDATRPHALGEAVLDLIDLDPAILVKVIEDAQRSAGT